jgi:hypothetical protein
MPVRPLEAPAFLNQIIDRNVGPESIALAQLFHLLNDLAHIARLSHPRWNKHRHGLTALGNQDALTFGYALEELGQVRLCFVGADGSQLVLASSTGLPTSLLDALSLGESSALEVGFP